MYPKTHDKSDYRKWWAMNPMHNRLRVVQSPAGDSLCVLMLLVLLATSACSQPSGKTDPPTVRTTATYAFDPFVPAELRDASTEIFFGRVTTGAQNEIYPNGDMLPLTGFDVTVTDVLKGQPGESVTVYQQGGEIKDSDDVTLFERDSFLKNGSEYLFFVNDESGQRLLIPVLGNQIASDATAKANLRDKYR